MKRIGLIAGNGKFPIIFAQAAKNQGITVIAVAIKEETSKELDKYVDKLYWISVGELKKLFKFLKSENINKAVMVGKVTKTLLFNGDIHADEEIKLLLKTVSDKRDNSLLAAVAERLDQEGVTLVDATTFLTNLLPEKGILTKKEPTPEQWRDIHFGKEMAKYVASLDIGQTIVVKDKAILAVEAIEGTDEAIKRGGKLGNGEVIVVKARKPEQDTRFEIPVVGPQTVESLIEARAVVLAIEAQKTLIIDKEKTLKMADDANISIAAV